MSRMGFWMRREFLVFLLVFSFHTIFYSKGAKAKIKRHSNLWWRKYHSISGWGAPRGMDWGDTASILNYHPDNSQPLPAYGSSRSIDQPRPPSQAMGPIGLQCGQDKMVVTVMRDFYGNGKLVRTLDLTLGILSCKPGVQSTDTSVVFDYGLHECGIHLGVTEDFLVYSTFLSYSPSSTRSSPIVRSNSARVPIRCFYPRHHNVSSEAIKPTWIPSHSTISVEEKVSFSLRLMADDWRNPRISTMFQLGDVLNIEAAVDTQNHGPMRIFVDRCVATQSPEANPSYVITQNGCLEDGKQEDSSSAFKSPRPQPNKLQFTIDAFRFTESDESMIFITCALRAADANVVPDSTNKACSFNRTRNMWSPVEGPDHICSCCEMGSCVLSSSQSRTFGTTYEWRRLQNRRDLSGPHKPGHQFTTLGPLYVVGPKSQRVLKTQTIPPVLQIWMVGVGLLWVVVLPACVLVWKTKSKENVQPTQ